MMMSSSWTKIKKTLRKIMSMATEILKSCNIFVNEDKTNFTHVHLATRKRY